MRIGARREIFGPVATVTPAKGITNEALELANDTAVSGSRLAFGTDEL